MTLGVILPVEAGGQEHPSRGVWGVLGVCSVTHIRRACLWSRSYGRQGGKALQSCGPAFYWILSHGWEGTEPWDCWALPKLPPSFSLEETDPPRKGGALPEATEIFGGSVVTRACCKGWLDCPVTAPGWTSILQNCAAGSLPDQESQGLSSRTHSPLTDTVTVSLCDCGCLLHLNRGSTILELAPGGVYSQNRGWNDMDQNSLWTIKTFTDIRDYHYLVPL